MIPFTEVNVNPKGHKTGDCAVRAIVGVTGMDYRDAIKACAKYACKLCYGITDKQVVEAVLKEYGFIKMKQPRKASGKKYTVSEMDKILTEKQMKQGVLVTVAGHHTCIVNGSVQDTWDCRYKTVGNYYVKRA